MYCTFIFGLWSSVVCALLLWRMCIWACLCASPWVCVFWYRWTKQSCITQICFSVTLFFWLSVVTSVCGSGSVIVSVCLFSSCLSLLFMSVCLNFYPVRGLRRLGSKTVSKSLSRGWDTAHKYLPATLNTCFVLFCRKTPTILRNTILYIKDEALSCLGCYNGRMTVQLLKFISLFPIGFQQKTGRSVHHMIITLGFVIQQEPDVSESIKIVLYWMISLFVLVIICTQ